MYFKIITFGCKLNQAESETISADLISTGFYPVPINKKPNFVIINVCAVTAKAVRQGRQKTSFVKRNYPRAKIIVTGCLDEKNWPGVDFWVTNKDKSKIGEIASSHIKSGPKVVRPPSLRNRALIKIQTGCNNFCTYCIVPYTRGKPTSLPAGKIIQEILNKEKQGFQEVVLTGINIGLYNDKGIGNLVPLLKLILKETKIERIRLGSLWPTHVTSSLISLVSKEERLCPHFHLSIQSGSPKILKSMGRYYTPQNILSIVNLARKKIPLINFTSDIIVGFPGEGETDFKKTCQLVDKIGFSKVHIFKYSKRPQTKAILLENQVKDKVKQARSITLKNLADIRAKQVKEQFIGKSMPILWEEKKENSWYGFTHNYIKVKKKATSSQDLKGQIQKINAKLCNLIF